MINVHLVRYKYFWNQIGLYSKAAQLYETLFKVSKACSFGASEAAAPKYTVTRCTKAMLPIELRSRWNLSDIERAVPDIRLFVWDRLVMGWSRDDILAIFE